MNSQTHSIVRRLVAFTAAILAINSANANAEEKRMPTVAVLYFDYEGSNAELTQLRKGFAQMLTSDLTEVESIHVVERARLQEVIQEIDLSKSAKFDPSTAARIGKLLGAGYLVLGSYFEVQGHVRFDARLVHTETGRVLKAAGVTARPEDLLDAESKLADKLRVAIESADLKPGKKVAEARPAGKKEPVSTKAVAAYGRALDAIDRTDKPTAQKELKEALYLSPGFKLAAADLSRLAL